MRIAWAINRLGILYPRRTFTSTLLTTLTYCTRSFFPLFEGGNHWSGWAAVNPWVQLARVLYKHGKHLKKDKKAYKDLRGYRQLANGLIACDGLHTKGVSHTRQIIWFLNLVSAYCNMLLEKMIS